MPTFRHGKSAVFTITDGTSNTTTVQDISNVIQDVGFSRSIDLGEVTALGNSAKAYITGLQDASISVSMKYDSTVDGYIQTVISALTGGTQNYLSWTYKANSGATSATNPVWSGTAVIKSYEVKAGVGDVVASSLELQVTGTITRATS